MHSDHSLRKGVAVHEPIALLLLCLLSWSTLSLANDDVLTSSSSELQPTSESESAYEVVVTDFEGQPVKNVVVEFHLTTPTLQSTNNTATMDQIDQQFTPHILVIEKGTIVSFPNSDNIRHHIYSFSTAKTFEQALYEQMQATPIRFDISGIIDLGCNIHDWMLAYIYVANSHYFAKTNDLGKVEIAVPVSIESVSIWHPRMQEGNKRVMTMASSSFHLTNPVCSVMMLMT